MLKVRFFVNEPCGKPWRTLQEMLPRLGEKYEIEMEVISKPKIDYFTDEYEALSLPPAPAAMVNDEVVLRGGADISEEKLEAAIHRHLGLPELPVEPKKGLLGRFFK